MADKFEIRVQDWDRRTTTYQATSEDQAKKIINREKKSKWVAAIFVAKNNNTGKIVHAKKASANPNIKKKKDFR